jgi:DNA repair photolyase
MGKVNKAKGNMYDWLTHTWSPGIGCSHQCSYCYVRKYREQPSEFKLDLPFPPLGKGKMIFVGHLCDMWAKDVSRNDIAQVLEHCAHYPNSYIFQSKNPERFETIGLLFPPDTLLGATVETNRQGIVDKLSKAPPIMDRLDSIRRLNEWRKCFITIEPILDFDLDIFTKLIVSVNPAWVNIGADSKSHNLPEPPPEKVRELAFKLTDAGVEVRNKENLLRILDKEQK